MGCSYQLEVDQHYFVPTWVNQDISSIQVIVTYTKICFGCVQKVSNICIQSGGGIAVNFRTQKSLAREVIFNHQFHCFEV